MKKAEQKKFVKNLANSVLDDVLRALKNDEIPASWDGTELRQLLADKLSDSNDMEPERRLAYEKILRLL